jgi:hypothetical protein
VDIQAELNRLYQRAGKLTPQLVVDEASDPANPLHEHFEWDDAVAAHEHRLSQARALIRKVKITYLDADDRPQEVRAFVSIPSNGGRVYRHVDHVAENPFQLKLILAQMEREWQGMMTRWGRYDEFWHLVQSGIEETGDEL